MRRIRNGALCLLALAVLLPAVGVSAQIPRRSRQTTDDQAIRSAVLVYGGVECDTAPVAGTDLAAPVLDTCTAGWTGSGTIVDPSGLVMTNAHIALGDDGEPMWTVIGLTDSEDELPTLAFFAFPFIYDQDIDLAVLAPVFTLDGEFIEEGALDLPPLLLPNDAGAVAPGDQIRLIGYPGLEDEEVVSVEETEILGTVPDEVNSELGDAGWLDAGAFAGPGISGGAAVSDSGLLVGVPTGGRAGDAGGQPQELVRPMPEALGVLVTRAEAAGQLGDNPPEDPTPAPDPPVDPTPEPRRSPRRQPPVQTPEPAQETTAIIQGTFVSADTGGAVAGALFLILQPGVTVQDFVDADLDSSLVYGVGVSDGSGFFQIEPALARNQPYSFVIVAEGYQPLAGDDLVVADDTSPAVVDIGAIELATAQ